MVNVKKILEGAHDLTYDKLQLLSKLNLERKEYLTLRELVSKKIEVNSLKTILWAIIKVLSYGFVFYNLITSSLYVDNIIVDFLLSLFLLFALFMVFFRFVRELFSLMSVKQAIKNKEIINNDFVNVFTKKLDIIEIKKNLSEQKQKIVQKISLLPESDSLADKYVIDTLKSIKAEQGFNLNYLDFESLSLDHARSLIYFFTKRKEDDYEKLLRIIEKELRLLTAHE